nr:hypothetical protein CFP56_27341 [Quercus suber]
MGAHKGKKESQQYGPWLRATMANPQQTQVVHTKTPPPTASPSTQRPTPSPITRPSPVMERAQNLPENPPSLSKNDNLVISATYPETTPTNKEILSDPILFRTHITEIDHALNSFQNSNQQTLLTQLDTTPATNTPAPPSPYTPKSTNTKKNTSDAIVTHVTTTLPITDHTLHSFQNSHQPSLHTQLANTPATYSQPSPSPCPPKSGITKTETNAAKVTHVTDTMPPITDHDIHAIHQNSNSSITSTPLDLVGPKQSSWRRLGPPRHIMDTSGTCDHMSGSKRKSSEEVIMEDSFDEKKQKLLNEEARITWRLTGFYGHPDTNKREETWTLLESLGRSNTLPWLCLGDYNEILSQTEKAGGRLRPARQMDRFRMAISHCGFLDLGYRGSPFTWSRNHPTEGRIRIRLDRALATVAWKSKFPGASVQHLSMSASDHSMIAVHLPPFKTRLKRPRPPFRFEAMWLHDPRCAEIVEEAWMEGLYNPNGAPISNCLESCRARLSAWNKTEFGHVGKQIARLEKELQSLEQHPHPNHEKIEEATGSEATVVHWV